MPNTASCSRDLNFSSRRPVATSRFEDLADTDVRCLLDICVKQKNEHHLVTKSPDHLPSRSQPI